MTAWILIHKFIILSWSCISSLDPDDHAVFYRVPESTDRFVRFSSLIIIFTGQVNRDFFPPYKVYNSLIFL